MRKIKEMLESGEVINTFAVGRFTDPTVVEMFAFAGGHQAFWIDQEHVSSPSSAVYACAAAGRSHGLDCFVRMAPTGYSQVTQYLELGAGGVMAAQIYSAQQAKEFTSWAKFPPLGMRGLNTGGFDAGYASQPPAEFVSTANDSNFLAIQIETAQSLDEAEEIASIEGVDMLFVGPSDLSMQLGVVGQFHSDELWCAIERVATACKNTGKTWGAVVTDSEFCERAVALGCQMPTMGNGVRCLKMGINAVKEAFPGRFPKE